MAADVPRIGGKIGGSWAAGLGALKLRGSLLLVAMPPLLLVAKNCSVRISSVRSLRS